MCFKNPPKLLAGTATEAYSPRLSLGSFSLACIQGRRKNLFFQFGRLLSSHFFVFSLLLLLQILLHSQIFLSLAHLSFSCKFCIISQIFLSLTNLFISCKYFFLSHIFLSFSCKCYFLSQFFLSQFFLSLANISFSRKSFPRRN